MVHRESDSMTKRASVTAGKVTGLGNAGDINYTTTATGGTSLLLKLGLLLIL